MWKATNCGALALLLILGACASPEKEVAAPAEPVTFEGRDADAWADEVLKGQNRLHATTALGTIGKPAVPSIRRLLSHPAAQNRVAGANALLLMPAGTGAEVVPELTALLDAKEQSVVVSSCRALQHQGQEAVAANEALPPLLEAESWLIRYHAARTLGTIDQLDPEVKKTLEHLGRHDLDNRVRKICRQAAEGIPVELEVQN